LSDALEQFVNDGVVGAGAEAAFDKRRHRIGCGEGDDEPGRGPRQAIRIAMAVARNKSVNSIGGSRQRYASL
jgi:hypothetical protein